MFNFCDYYDIDPKRTELAEAEATYGEFNQAESDCGL